MRVESIQEYEVGSGVEGRRDGEASWGFVTLVLLNVEVVARKTDRTRDCLAT